MRSFPFPNELIHVVSDFRRSCRLPFRQAIDRSTDRSDAWMSKKPNRGYPLPPIGCVFLAVLETLRMPTAVTDRPSSARRYTPPPPRVPELCGGIASPSSESLRDPALRDHDAETDADPVDGYRKETVSHFADIILTSRERQKAHSARRTFVSASANYSVGLGHLSGQSSEWFARARAGAGSVLSADCSRVSIVLPVTPSCGGHLPCLTVWLRFHVSQ